MTSNQTQTETEAEAEAENRQTDQIPVTREWVGPESDEMLRKTFAHKRIGWGAFEVRCRVCHTSAEKLRGPRGDGQTRDVRYGCSAEDCEGDGGYVTKVRTSNPRMVISGQLEVRVGDTEPWTVRREVPTPLRCDFCGFEGSPPEEVYPYSEDGFEPAPGYKTVFQRVDPPEHLTRDHDSTTFVQCPRCTRYNRPHSFKQEFTRNRDGDGQGDNYCKDEFEQYCERDGSEFRELDRVRWADGDDRSDDEELYVVLSKTFNSKYAEFETPNGDFVIARVRDLRSACFGFPTIYAATGPKTVIARCVERGVPLFEAYAADLSFVHRGPLVVSGNHSNYLGGRVR